jgi:hypothetical protein
VRKLPLVLLGAATLPLIAMLGAWRLDAFLRSEAPPIHVQTARAQPAPFAACTYGRLDRRRPRAWSVTEEAAVYAVIVRSEFLPTLSDDGQALERPRAILIDPRTIEPRLAPGQIDPWPMNFACEQMFGLRVSTSASFRRANRHPGAPVFRWLSLPIPLRFVQPGDTLLQSLVDTAGYVRFSRAGFSDDFTQALVVVERIVRDGFGQGIYYLLEQRGRGWQVVDRATMWIT